jgi:hypothetical protein
LLKNLWQKFRDSTFAVLPVTAIVIISGLTFVKMDAETMVAFVTGAILLIMGMALFSLGADMAMMPMGESMGGKLASSKKLWLIIPMFFLIGFIIIIAEPDVHVLAEQINTVPKLTMIMAISIGVGAFLVLFLLKVFTKIKMSHLLIILYSLLFVLAIFVPKNFLPIAFDSGAVATGPICVPFVMALAIGFGSVRSGTNEDNSFGMVAFSLIGPMFAVMLLGIIYKPADITPVVAAPFAGSLLSQYAAAFVQYLGEVGLALAPILGVYLVFQIFALKKTKRQLVKILIGFLYTYLGLTIFLMAVNVGFMPAGKALGAGIAANYKWLLIPFGMVVGFVVVLAEPAVHVLVKQVEELTGGAISRKISLICLTVAVSLSVGLAMIRVMTGISIWYIILPGYVIALTMSLFVPSVFTSIAFDSGAVASGPMTVTFLLPLAMGASAALGGNIMTDAFGIVAFVSMTPPLTLQIFGVIYSQKLKSKKKKAAVTAPQAVVAAEEPVDFE